MSERSSTGSHVIVRLISILAIGAVAAALLVGFFFDGNWSKALREVTGKPPPKGKFTLATSTVQAFGEVRLDGSCAAVAEKARAGAAFNAERDAKDKCRARVQDHRDVSVSIKIDDAGEVVLDDLGGRCVATVQQTWTCMFDGR